jgi:hypothetical protein
MTYREALNLILRAYPGPTDAMLVQKAKDRFRTHQLRAAVMKHDGWAFLRREAIIRSNGGYNVGTIAVTQDSADVVLTGGTFPDPCAGWIIGPTASGTERYKIKSRTDDTNIVLERPYEGATAAALNYAMYEMPLRLPLDYYMAESMVAEAEGRQLGFANLGMMRGVFPKPVELGSAKVVGLSEPTKSAAYETGTVTITENSATVTGSGTVFPTWCVDHFVRFENETVWFKIKSRDSDTQVTLWRTYSGLHAGSGKSYQIDPPGCLQFDYLYPRDDQFTIKLAYYCVPEEPVNDTDVIEGGEPYARALCDLAAADMLTGLSTESLEHYRAEMMSMIKSGQGMLQAMIGGDPEPQQTPVMSDIRYSNRLQW